MPRYIRNTVALAKKETSYGVDPTPTGAANALMVSNVKIKPYSFKAVERQWVRAFLGGYEKLMQEVANEVSFDVELQGSGALGVAPAWGPLMLGSGFSETVYAAARVEYLPVSGSFDSATFYIYDDGLLHKFFGARGSFDIKFPLLERPMISFRFVGLNGGHTATANVVPTLTGWKAPVLVNDANTGDVTVGCTYSTGALSGGTSYPSKGLDIASGIQLEHVPLLGGESVDLTARVMSAKTTLELTADQEVTFYNALKGETKQGLGLLHGTAAGYKVLVHAANGQITTQDLGEHAGRRMIDLSVEQPPTTAGNDEFRLVVL